MPCRKVPLVNGYIYHITVKSIANFTVFSNESEYQRMMESMSLNIVKNPHCKLSRLMQTMKKGEQESLHPGDSEKIVKILAYCLMPTHIHLALQQMTDGGISNFIYRLLKGYSQYFNLKHARKGPLWEGRFVNILVKTDGQLLHLTRYIHLNPVTALLVDKPEEWKFSSYREYVSLLKEGERKICDFSHQLTINAEGYKKFVLDRIDYQRKLALIKHLSGE